MPAVAYIPYAPTARSVEAGWLADHLGTPVELAAGPSLNLDPGRPLPPLDALAPTLDRLLAGDQVVAEGPGGFLWTALLRARRFGGRVTVLPYLNPRTWHDVAAATLYRRFASPADRVFVGSTPSAAVYRSLGIEARVGEPFGVDDSRFGVRPGAASRARDALSIPAGRVLLYTGRAQPDKDLYRLVAVGLKARLLFPDLRIVIASHVVDRAYLGPAAAADGVHVVVDPSPDRLADLYNAAGLFVTASTSHFETFGRAPAEALCCGTPAVAPRYDGFAEVLDQPGGTLVDLEPGDEPRVDEAKLLRAVYDVLSDPAPPPRADISAIARRRFGRSTTIRLFDHDGPLGPVQPAAAALDLPPAWNGALAELAARDPEDAISYAWHGCDHRRLAEADGHLVTAVRRSLGRPQEELACR
jgi:glycosyltransferase involved in cell wall biosynthesis